MLINAHTYVQLNLILNPSFLNFCMELSKGLLVVESQFPQLKNWEW